MYSGRNTKIHAVVDALGNPIHVQLSSGDIHDSGITEDVLDHVELEPNGTAVLADKAYDSFEFREYIADRDADFRIPPKNNSVDPCCCDFVRHKEPHVAECFFNKLKENRRIATRFDKLAYRFLAFVHLGWDVFTSCLHGYTAGSKKETHPNHIRFQMC